MTNLSIQKPKRKGKIKTGREFGRLTVMEYAGKNKSKLLYKCLCECGNIKIVQGGNLRSGHSKSCGCINTENITKHGMHNTPEYRSWNHMLQRCNNPNNDSYKNYGGRNITVCPEWSNSFIAFYKDMGARPEGFTIERKNNNGNYEPNNCIWTNRTEQQRNQRVRKTNKTGVNGIWWDKRRFKYYVRITVNGKCRFIGRFATLGQAKTARIKAEGTHWGI